MPLPQARFELKQDPSLRTMPLTFSGRAHDRDSAYVRSYSLKDDGGCCWMDRRGPYVGTEIISPFNRLYYVERHELLRVDS
jgi:hypothetical protein